MAKKHDWGYKRVDNSYYVLCKECGHLDRKFDNEEEAKNRIIYMRVLGAKPSNLQKHFPKRLF